MTQTQMTDKQLLDNFDLIGTKKYVATQCKSERERLSALLISEYQTNLRKKYNEN